ncbi:MAG: hypothetical protein HWN68_11140 [Desulfobacterales bacterium]|nr:hypothetical protein [Desulfobacterales bacterium]
MGAIAAIAAAIWSAIAAAAAAVASVIWAAVVFMAQAIAAIASAMASIVSTVIGAISSALSTAYSAVVGWASGIVTTITESLSGIYATVAEWATMLYDGIAGFLEAIHFKTLLTIHEIAYIVSDEYRAMFHKVTERISAVSQKLGLGSQFLNLCFREARGLVLSASSLLGRPYDIGEITWLSTFDGFLQKFQDKIETYERNPAEVFYDVDRWIVRDATNVQTEAVRAVYVGLDEAVEGFKKSAAMVVDVRDRVNNLVTLMPEQIREEIAPRVAAVTKYVDSFIYDIYRPTMLKADRIVKSLKDSSERMQGDMKDVIDKLKRPGDLLGTIDDLPLDERLKQERRIGEIATRGYRRDVDTWRGVAAPEHEGFLKVIEALKKEYPPPPYEIEEVEVPARPAGAPVEPRKTWFVGDY